jgi:hypothetical protein
MRKINIPQLLGRKIGKALVGSIIVAVATLWQQYSPDSVSSTKKESPEQLTPRKKNPVVLDQRNQFKEKIRFFELSNVKVIKLLSDDNYSPRHQRWIVENADRTQFKVVHNIDLSERVPIKVGEKLDLGGELVYDEKNGKPILHWTHADPYKKRKNGYIIHKNIRYGQIKNN